MSSTSAQEKVGSDEQIRPRGCVRRRFSARSIRLIGDADPEGSDDLGVLAPVDRGRGITKLLELDTTMHVPRAEVAGAAERYCNDPANAEVAEFVVHTRQLIVV